MAKKNRREPDREEARAAADYYKLNVRAVDDLVNADASNSPPVSQAELRKYRAGHGIKMADWVKAVLLKAWFAGMVCFFFLWGLGAYVSSQLDLLFIAALALGFVTDLITNSIFRYYAKTPGANDRWMMFPGKRFISLPLNVLYGFLLTFLVFITYNALNQLLIALTGANQDSVPLGVEPILFGVFTMGWDMLFLGIKRTFKSMLADARKSAGRADRPQRPAAKE